VEPALWPVGRYRHFNKEVGSDQWLESGFYSRPRMAQADARESWEFVFAPTGALTGNYLEQPTA